MKMTKANVAEYADKHSLEAVQIDGIPEGFSWKVADIQIGEDTHIGEYIAFAPLNSWDDERGNRLRAPTKQELLDFYKKYTKNHA